MTLVASPGYCPVSADTAAHLEKLIDIPDEVIDGFADEFDINPLDAIDYYVEATGTDEENREAIIRDMLYGGLLVDLSQDQADFHGLRIEVIVNDFFKEYKKKYITLKISEWRPGQ